MEIRKDCAFYQKGMIEDYSCSCLTKLVCIKRGNCSFYKEKGSVDFNEIERCISGYSSSKQV